ncbi:carbohydrate ABC transporter permease [Paenibacillus sp. TRM 82003]|nr:carbohydrate ABC transporter permease [Paenibacillus sp. TRM 82003]
MNAVLRSFRPANIAHYVLLTALAAAVVYPVYFAVSYGLMTSQAVESYPPPFLPSPVYFGNMFEVLNLVPLVRFIGNSLIVSSLIMIGELITGALAAYAFAFLRFKGRDLLFAVFLATLMVPGEVTVIPNFLTVRSWGWMDTYWGLSVPHMSTAFGIFLLRQFFLQLPKDLGEAARMDGCGHLRFFFSMVLPLSRPALGTLAVYSFMKAWNMYLWPLLMTNQESMRTVQIGIAMLKKEEYMSWNLILAGVTLVVLPSLLLLVVGLKQLVRGITGGAVKQ